MSPRVHRLNQLATLSIHAPVERLQLVEQIRITIILGQFSCIVSYRTAFVGVFYPRTLFVGVLYPIGQFSLAHYILGQFSLALFVLGLLCVEQDKNCLSNFVPRTKFACRFLS